MRAKQSHHSRRNKQQRFALKEHLQALLVAVRMLSSVVLVVALLWLVKAGYERLDQPVALVTVQGDFNNVSRAELANWIEPSIQNGMVSLSLSRLKQAMERHPWIAEANVSRRWPDNLLIEVVEEIPLARWGERGFLNSHGEPLAIEDNSRLQSLPMLKGEDGSERQLMIWLGRWGEILAQAELKITALEEDRAGRLRIQLKDAPSLLLGQGDYEQKLQRFVVVWRQQLQQQAANVEQVDLRYGNGLAVRWRNGGASMVVSGNQMNKFTRQTVTTALLRIV